MTRPRSRVLYLANHHTPYRDAFFNQLGTACDLTVLFDRRSDARRDASWFAPTTCTYDERFVPEREGRLSTATMRRMVREGWDAVVVGCYNEPRQMLLIEWLKLRGIPYLLNIDGHMFTGGAVLKRALRNHVLRGAAGYLIAGESSVDGLRDIVGAAASVHAYPFSSLTRAEVKRLAQRAKTARREQDLVLCVGNFEHYKGVDVLLDAAQMLPDMRFRCIGMGDRTPAFDEEVRRRRLGNVERVPFMAPDALVEEYLRAGIFVLPSRQECWGLVINEAAACGVPVVSTWGAGAAVEFIGARHPELLAVSGDAQSLAACIERMRALPDDERRAYGDELMRTARAYTIEAMVEAHHAPLTGAAGDRP